MGKIKVTLKRSPINRKEEHKRTVRALGFKRLNQTVEHEATPQILGMVNHVRFMVDVEEVES